ncbi:hypothetical protein SDC9_94850 [bioreactor metagenome]|uniref:Uncharacterized protein n=1 Tax=bioreactor metagenome TaxID=1076179 RepID=A0A645A5Z3_9ZZZZ
MLKSLFEVEFLREVVHLPIDPDPYKAALAGIVKNFLMLPLALPNDWGQYLNSLSVRQFQNAVDNLVDRLLCDFAAADGAVRNADAGIEQAQVVVNFGHGPNR